MDDVPVTVRLLDVLMAPVAVRVPPTVKLLEPSQLGYPVDSLVGVIPPFFTMIAPDESSVVTPSMAPEVKVELSTRLPSLVDVTCSAAVKV